MSKLTILAPAKLNLTLEVLGKRPDGYHEIRSVIQTINLADSLYFQPNENIELKSNSPEWVPEKSLVSKTINLIREASGCSKGATITINKRIPLMSGLGGDSSDAAAVLRGLNQLWNLALPFGRLLEFAQRLGSDVAFFLYDGTALVEGRGEIVTPLPSLSQMWVILVMPAVPRPARKTKQLYESLRAEHYTDGQTTLRLVEELKRGEKFAPSLLFNTFENVAFTQFPGLDTCREQMITVGATNVHLAGSGPALFTMARDKTQAQKLFTRLQQPGLETYLLKTRPAMRRRSQ